MATNEEKERVGRLWMDVYNLPNRSDLRGTFPGVPNGDYDGFHTWIVNHGVREYPEHVMEEVKIAPMVIEQPTQPVREVSRPVVEDVAPVLSPQSEVVTQPATQQDNIIEKKKGRRKTSRAV